MPLAAWTVALALTVGFGWTSRARWAEVYRPERTRPIVSVDLNAPPARPTAPAPTIDRETSPPTVRWDPGGGRWSMCLWADSGERFGGTFETLGLAYDSGAARIPAAVWKFVAPGTTLTVVLRRVDPAPGSAPVEVTAPSQVQR